MAFLPHHRQLYASQHAIIPRYDLGTQTMIVVSHVQLRPILAARQAGRATATTSLDLGLTSQEVHLEAGRVVLTSDDWLPWAAVDDIAGTPTACYLVEGGAATKIQAY